MLLRGLLVSLAVITGGLGVRAEAKITRYLTGSAADARPLLYGPALNLGGGGADVDPAIQWMIDQARGCTSCSTRVDVVVLRASGADGYNAPVFAMQGVDSVETLVLTARRDADDTGVEATVRNAEVVFFAGGDQCNYITLFGGTRLQQAVASVYTRGGAVGGTSAGAMLLGEHVYTACNGSVFSSEALADPYNRYMAFSQNFLVTSELRDAVVDTHFVPRDRMGRLMTFVARRIQDGLDPTVLGIGLNEATSLVVDRNGVGTVMGAGPVYFVHGPHAPNRCVALQPLGYSGFRVWKVGPGGTFNVRSWPTSGFTTVDVNSGVLSANPY